MYTPVFLKTENELNKVLRTQKKSRKDLGVLFVSLWDQHSQNVVETITKKAEKAALRDNNPNRRVKPLYIVDSFKMPHAFVIFKTTKLPHLVQFKRSGMESEDYLSKIYDELGL